MSNAANTSRLANTVAPRSIQKVWARKLWTLADTLEGAGHGHVAEDIREDLPKYVNVTPNEYKAFMHHTQTVLLRDMTWQDPETGETLYE